MKSLFAFSTNHSRNRSNRFRTDSGCFPGLSNAGATPPAAALSVLAVALTVILLLPVKAGFGQYSPSNYEAFRPLTMPDYSSVRTAAGTPGPDYWQNDVDYRLEVELNEENHEISGSVSITYTNNSPDDLPFVWLKIDQNLFHPESRGAQATPVFGSRFGNPGFEGGMTISAVRVEHAAGTYEPDYVISDTRMQVRLEEALQSGGDEITLSMNFTYIVPENGSDRTGRLELQDGWVYQIAQWYPRMAVYDDVTGWSTRPYMGAGEFYADHGSFDMKITVPHDHIVMASGELMNPEQVLTERQRERLEEARNSEETVYIIAPDEIGDPGNRPASSGTLTWHFQIDQSRDAAWATSRGFIWDAAGAEMPSGKIVTAMSVYPAESDGDHAWGRSTEYTRASVMHYSEKWYEYPWPAAVNVAGIVRGMEYPAISFCSWESQGSDLWGVTDHEFGHNWFPMIVGTNERKYMWMDEGMNILLNHYSTQAFNDGEYPTRFDSARDFAPHLASGVMEPIMTHPEQISEQTLGIVAYFKPAAGLLMLREDILGPERFDYAFRHYINSWAFKKPTPMDFFRAMNNASGENLDWFWRGWFYETWLLDQAVESVEYIGEEENPEVGVLITIASKGDLVMPAVVEVTEVDGTVQRYELPVEIWHRGNEWTFVHEASSAIEKVVIDPDRRLPDINPRNNTWESE